MENRYFYKNGGVIAFNPLQISEGAEAGLIELSDKERESHLNQNRLITVESLKSAVTQKRWEVETGGITLPTGVSVATGIDDQNRITSVVANAERAGVAEVDFKAGSGWVRVTAAELQSIAAAIALHVQACFSAERAHHEAIDSLEAAHADNQEALQHALQAYDLEQGWPATDLREPQPA